MERKNRWFLACLAALLLLGGCQPSEENTEDPTPQQQEETKGPEQDGTSTEGPVVEEEGDVSENVASVLEVMLTGPNEKLYNPDMVTIVGLGEDMTEEEKKEKDKKNRQEPLKGDPDRDPEAEYLSSKERTRRRLAEARKKDAEKYGEEYIEVTDKDMM